MNSDEIIDRGIRFYEENIRPKIEAENRGKFLVINVESGEYEIDVDDVAAARRAKNRFPGAPLFSMRVGSPVAYRLGIISFDLRS